MQLDIASLPHPVINRLSFALRKQLAARFKVAGQNVSAEEWAVMMMLAQKDGQTPSALAEQTIRDRTTMTRLLDGLVGKALVQREVDQSDRRKSRILLTKSGRLCLASLRPLAEGLVQKTLQDIPPAEVEICVSVLQKMLNNIR